MGPAASPYFDGESLLAITKAAKYLGPAYAHLWPVAAGTARRLRELHVVGPLRKHRDPSETKGVYQWLSMSLHELATVKFGSGRTERYDLPASLRSLHRVDELGGWLIDLGVWMVDVHRTLDRSANTGYAYEGLVPAWAWGAHVLSGRGADANPRLARTVQSFHCTIHRGLDRLIGWQVGMGAEAASDHWDGLSGRGGVQNRANDSGLRIDVTQHQMHATILARRFLYPDEGASWLWHLAI